MTTPPDPSPAAHFIAVDWFSWTCAKCCWTVPPAIREEAACQAAIRAHITSHEVLMPDPAPAASPDSFHSHLKACERCRVVSNGTISNLSTLCPVGRDLLLQDVSDVPPAASPGQLNVDRLRERFNKLRAEGLRDLKIWTGAMPGHPADLSGVTVEELAGEMLDVLDAIERRDFVDISEKLL